MILSRDYIKGFFDGEGCAFIKQKTIIISNTNKNLIDDVRETLESLNIRTHLKLGFSKNPKHKTAYQIRIYDYYSNRNFIDLIGSNHEEKRKKLFSIIQSYTRIPLSDTEKDKIIELRKKGLSYQKIAKCVHRSPGTCSRIVKNATITTTQ
jgi:intein-encoded DNA endonuclease-like protein